MAEVARPNTLPKSLFFIFMVALLVTMYYPILGTYAHTDSYEFFWSARRNPDFLIRFIQDGRPIYGLVLTKLFRSVATIEGLQYIRLIAFAGNALLIFSFYRFLIRSKYQPVFVMVLTVFLACSAFICLSMAWTATFQTGWGMLVALASAVSCIRGSGRDERLVVKCAYLTAGTLAGVVSLMLFQPSFTLFVFIVFLQFERDNDYRKLIQLLVLYILIVLLYFGIFKTVLWVSDIPELWRSGVSTDITGKLRWFADNAFVHSMSFNLLLINNAKLNLFRGPVGLFFALCAVFFFLRRGLNRDTIIYAFLIVGIYLLAYLPNLASQESHASNRSLGTVVMLNAYFLYKGVYWVIKERKWRLTITAALTMLFIVFGYTNLRYGIVRIQSAEYAILRSETQRILEQDRSNQVHQINVIRPDRGILVQNRIVLKESVGEFGLLSNSVEWTTIPMFNSFLEEFGPATGHQPSEIKINVCSPEEAERCNHSEGPVIDIGSLFLERYPTNPDLNGQHR